MEKLKIKDQKLIGYLEEGKMISFWFTKDKKEFVFIDRSIQRLKKKKALLFVEELKDFVDQMKA